MNPIGFQHPGSVSKFVPGILSDVGFNRISSGRRWDVTIRFNHPGKKNLKFVVLALFTYLFISENKIEVYFRRPVNKI